MRRACLFALALVACGGPAPPHVAAPSADVAPPIDTPPAGCTADRWCRDLPSVPFHGGRAVWASAPDDVWLAEGSLYHFDGRRWEPVVLPVTDDVIGLWGDGPRAVYAIAGPHVLRFDGDAWSELVELESDGDAIWARGRDVFVAEDNVMRRFDGERWSEHDIGVHARGFFGRAADDLFVALESGHVGHFDGTAWRIVAERLGRLRGISGTTNEVATVGVEPGTFAVRHGRGRFELEAMNPQGSRAIWTTPNGTHVLAGPFDTMWHLGPDGVRSYSARGMRPEWLTAIHGSSNEFAVAVGLYGAIRWNGTAWTRIDGGRDPNLVRVRGASADRVVALGDGASFRFDGTAWIDDEHPAGPDVPALRAVWASSISNAWAVGDGGLMVHYDGGTAQAIDPPTPETLRAIWGSGADDVRAVGDAGTIVRWDGRAWAPEASGTSEALHAIWGSAANDVWVGGSAGTVLHYDGASWARVPSDLRQPIVALHGTARDDVWAAGGGGELSRFDGRTWSAQLPLEETITSLYARSRHALFVADGHGVVRRSPDGRARRVHTENARAVSGAGAAVIAVGGRVGHDDGAGVWTVREGPAMRAVYAVDRATAFALGGDRTLLRSSGGGWETLHEPAAARLPPATTLRAVDAAGSLLVAIDHDGRFAWLDGVDRPRPAADPRLSDVAARAANDIVAVGEGGRVAEFDGDRWIERTLDGAPGLSRVFMASDGDAVAWSPGAALFRRRGGWQRTSLPSRMYVRAVWIGGGTVFVAGANGQIAQLVGDGWVAHADTRDDLTHVATFPGGAFAVGLRGTVVRWDGAAWSAIPAPAETDVIGAWASGPRDLWVVTMESVFRWDGRSWSTSFTREERWAHLRGIGGTSPRDVHLAADGGAAYRWDGAQWSRTRERDGYHQVSLVANAGDVFLYASHPRQLLRWESGAWAQVALPDVRELSSFHAIGGGRLIAVASAGRFGQLSRWDGRAWSSFTTPDGVYAVFGDETRGLFALTEYGRRVARFDGASWHDTGLALVEGEAIRFIASDPGAAIAVGRGGARYHYDGTTWRSGRVGTTADLLALWGSSATDVWAVGGGGATMHFDGVEWRNVSSGIELSLHAVWGRTPRDVYAVGDHGVVLHWDGERWSRQESGGGETLLDVWGTGDRVFAVGAGGLVLRRELAR